ncbi:MAG: hypothetical protein RL685_1934 [Pseudomonadota bacterium]|jgi:hypothetical protein
MTESNLVDGYLALTRQALTPSLALRERVLSRMAVGATAMEAGAAGLAGNIAAPKAALTAQGTTLVLEGASATGAAALEVPGALATGALAGTPSVAASQAARGKLGALLGGALLALGFVSGYWARGIDAQPPPLPVRPALQHGPAELAPEPALDGAARLQLDSAKRTPAASSRPRGSSSVALRDTAAPAASPSAAPSSTRDELALLQRTERAVRADNSALALVLLGELEANYPRSELLEERRALELLAHCVAHASDSLQRAERFLREHPRSVYAERIGALCQAEPAESETVTRPRSR